MEQRLVIYDKPGRKGAVYDTAYTDQQVEEAVKRCVSEHGYVGSHVRSTLAKGHRVG